MTGNVLITGGAGYLGSVMTRHLLDKGYKVTCIDNLMYGQQTPFLFSNNPNYEFIFGDARDEELIRKALSEIPDNSFDLYVIDVLKEPQKADDDKIIATPALVKESPPPGIRIIGDLSNTERILRMLNIIENN